MNKSKIFSEEELDAFKEMGNVGAGHAAIALTSMLNREVDMSVPYVKTGTPKEILDSIKLDADTLVGHEMLEVDEPIRYRLGLIFTTTTISNLLEILSTTRRENITAQKDLTDMQLSLIQEIGSVIILRYIAALNKMLRVESLPEDAPNLSLITASESISLMSFDDENDPEILLIQLDLFTDEKQFECHIFVQPHPNSVESYRKAFFG